jgi:AraC-like DNA-binding protein
MSGTFLASEIRLLRRILDELGIDADQVLQDVGIDPALASQPRARYPFGRVMAAWARGAQVARDPDFALRAGRAYKPTDFHGLAVSFLASRDLATALGRIARYHTVVNTAVDTRLEPRADRLDLYFSTLESDIPTRRMQEDSRAAIIVDLGRSGVGPGLDPVEVSFTYPEPPDRRALDTMLRCPLVFDAPFSRLSFRSIDGSLPFLASNRELARSYDRVLDDMVKSLRHGDLVSRVKLAMVDQLSSGTPSEQSIARAVSVSPRSLQRRLAAESTTFTEVLTAVRCELAERYVGDPDLPVTEIGYMLGFSDVAAFSRAFKRWTGQSPAERRRIARAA